MKLGLKALMVGALAAALLAPAAVAKPGNGQGHGAEKAHGKPAWAGKGQERKAENAARKEARRAARGTPDSEEPGADAPKHDNPAWICKFEREQMGDEVFADEYGENENKANAFGKCVSREAHDRDGVTPVEAAAPVPADEEPAPDEGEEGDELGDEALAALEALFQALRQLVF